MNCDKFSKYTTSRLQFFQVTDHTLARFQKSLKSGDDTSSKYRDDFNSKMESTIAHPGSH